MPEPVDASRENVFVSAQYVPTPPKVRFNTSSCVIFARQYTGNLEIKGIAGQIQPNRENPYIGGVVLLNEGPKGHVAVIENIQGDTLYIIEANYVANQITHRQLDINDKRIRGYR